MVTALVHAAYGKWVPLIGRKPLPMTVDYSAALAADRFDLLFAPTELVALVQTSLRADDLLIENLAVAPARQGQGIGRWLVSHAEQLAVCAGRARVRLYTNARFEANLRLYDALGYSIEREQILNGGVAVYMVKQLTG